MIDFAQPQIGEVLETGLPQGLDELVRRFHSHLTVRFAVDQHQRRQLCRYITDRRGLLVFGQSRSLWRATQKFFDYRVDLLMIELVDEVDRPAVADHRLDGVRFVLVWAV